jgi:glycerophosphoryl diester phosphodiesterase
MRITVFQPPYPEAATPQAASACQAGIRDQLQIMEPGKTELVVLPEYANAPGLTEKETLLQFAQNEGKAFVLEVASHAKRLEALIAMGTVCQRSGSQWVNRTWLFGHDGEAIAWYDKTHLTKMERKLGLTAGSEPVVIEHSGIRFGFAVCFDFYFPAYFEALAAQDVDVVLCPSYQRSESPERIRAMCQCRALDSGVYVVRSSYSMGVEDRGGDSLVAGPEGTILVNTRSEPGVVTVDINPHAKFMKPASHGQPIVEHRALIESNRRQNLYRPHIDQAREIIDSPFPRLCAHRGVSDVCPENTLPAFGAAIAMGVHEIELDLWMSADGVPIVCHDSSVDRTTDGEGLIAEMGWSDIQYLDAGIKLGMRWSGVRVPRFEDVLDAVDGRAGINIHIKEPGSEGRLVKLVCDLLRARGLPQIHYIAGDESVLEVAIDYAPEIPRACLAAQHEPNRMIMVAEALACTRVQFGRNATDDALRRARDLELICNLFWSDELTDAQRYVKMGIDVVLTNAAHKLLKPSQGMALFRCL